MRRNEHGPLFLFDAWFVRDVVKELAPYDTATPFVERGIFITDAELRNLRVCYRMSRRMNYVHQSAGCIRMTPHSTLDALMDFLRQGCRALVFAHSHPRTDSLEATNPSHTDMCFMKDMFAMGANILGMIVLTPVEEITFVRFFSHYMPFRVRVEGRGAHLEQKKGQDYVYRINM